MRVLKIECPECGSKAVIRKTNRKHRQIADIYCACSDVECGHVCHESDVLPHSQPKR